MQKINNKSFNSNNLNLEKIIGLAALLTSSYYFYQYSTFADNKNFFFKFLDLINLFLFSLIFFFFIKKNI